MAESPKIPRATFSSEDICPDLPPAVLDRIMMCHRLANAAMEAKRTVLRELKRVNEYADAFVGKLNTFETISPKFF